MKTMPCQLLDHYIAHDLIGEELVRFEAHLPACPVCQRALSEEASLDALIVEAVTRLEPAPSGLTERFARRLRTVRRRRRVVAAFAALAASVAVFLVARAALHVEPPQPREQAIVKPVPPVPPVSSAAKNVHVSFENTGVFAVPVPSESPNVTVIHVYTGLRTSLDASQGDEASKSDNERSDP